MSREKFELHPDAFSITPGGEVVIDHKELAKALKNSVNTPQDHLNAVSVGVVVSPN